MRKSKESLILAIVSLFGSTLFSTVRAQQISAPQSQQSAPANSQPKSAPSVPAQPSSTIDNIVVPGLDSEKAKVSYAIGMNIGSNFKKQSVELDEAALEKGLRDGFSGASTLITEEQAHTILNAYQAELRAKQMEKQRLSGETNKLVGEAFLKANQSKEGVVVVPSGLQYKILTAGVGPKPTASDTVICNYRGTLIDGTEFDSSAKHGGPATIPVSGVIKGWTEALQLMPVGSKWQLFIPSDLAYGERGAGGAIGPNSALIFEVELVSIKPKSEPAQSSGAAGQPAQPVAPGAASNSGASPKPQ